MGKCLSAWSLHQWGKWECYAEEPLYERSITDPKNETRVVGRVLYQKRVCEKCGLSQLRKDKAR
jgi:hypothetical protein